MNWFIIYFFTGFYFDILLTMYYIKIYEKSVITSGILSMAITAFSTIVLYYILLSPDAIPRIIAYALGNGFGTSLTIYWNKK